MDERERPPYLGDLPRDRRGNWPIYLLAAGMLAALIGGWKIYMGTVAAWQERFQTSKPVAAPPAPIAAQPQPTPYRVTRSPAEWAEIDRQNIETIRAFRERQAQRARRQPARESIPRGTMCVNGSFYQTNTTGRLERVPGVKCE